MRLNKFPPAVSRGKTSHERETNKDNLRDMDGIDMVRRLRDLPAGEEGTQTIEILLIVAFTVVPCFSAIQLLVDVLREYLGFETVLLTSPFF